MSDHMDDLYAERFRRSSWWPTDPADKPKREQPADDDLTTARRRRALIADAYDHKEETA